MPATQTNRQLGIVTPLGADVLLLAAFTGEERVSGLFRFDAELLSESADIKASDIVGKAVTLRVQREAGTSAYFNGFVRRFAAASFRFRGIRAYRAEIVPWLWFLTLASDCRIFQKKSAPEIVEQVFKGFGFTAYELRLQKKYSPRDYCVQYRESACAFVSRLLEEEGIFYYFTHDKSKHTLVLADHKGAYQGQTNTPAVDYSPGTLAPNHISAWEHRYDFVTGKWAQGDFHFETPATDLKTAVSTVVPLPDVKKYEKFEYPGGYTQKGPGAELTKVRMEQEEVAYEVIEGASTCSQFSPGGKFSLKSHDAAAEAGKKYVVTSIRHEAREASYESGTDGGFKYANTFTAIPDAVAARPARLTPRPVVEGPQTAIVVGPRGEEIYTDKYGRVKVQFHWDREGKKDENSSCWVRVSQGWAGKTWGMQFLPRVGQEVIVDFLEGDPDRPIITGRVYNAEQMPPCELPRNQTISVLRTRSTKGGGSDDFNELRFEDKKGSEDVYFHAQKDFHRVVENDDDLKVGRDQTIEIKKNEKVTIKEGDREIVIEKGKDTLTIKQGGHTTDAKESIELKVGGNNIKIDSSAISLTVGGNSIKIDSSGITLNGTKITLQAQAQVMIQ